MTVRIRELCITALLAAAAVSQPHGSSAIQIEACQVDLTEIGRLANFSFEVTYSLQTSGSGNVTTVSVAESQREQRDRFATFVTLDQLENCLRRWTLRPNALYKVRFEAGTTSDAACSWLLAVCQSVGECIEVRLPRCGAEP